MNFVRNKTQLQVVCRIYSSDLKVIEEIRRFICRGYIYQKRKEGLSTVYELSISKKSDVKLFLINIFPHILIKKGQVDFLLRKYNFNRGSNANFDVVKLRSFITKKNVEKLRKNFTIVRSTE